MSGHLCALQLCGGASLAGWPPASAGTPPLLGGLDSVPWPLVAGSRRVACRAWHLPVASCVKQHDGVKFLRNGGG